MTAPDPGMAAKLAFLRRRSSHPERPRQLDVVETHFAWVFIGDRIVRKLKKPAHTSRLDFRTLARREAGCRAELELNRELSPEVYLGVDRLTREGDDTLALDGSGPVVDWLVRMRRLPEARTLERARIVGDADIAAVAGRLAAFYRAAPPVPAAAEARPAQVAAALADLDERLARWATARSVLTRLRGGLETLAPLLVARAAAGRVVDGHGDLRPEHVYVTRPPRILDRIEFDPSLRRVDWLEDVALLAVDLEELRRNWIADALMRDIARRLDDVPEPRLTAFYRAWRACLRATLCLEHRAYPGRRTAAGWTRRARGYLDIAARYADRLSRA